MLPDVHVTTALLGAELLWPGQDVKHLVAVVAAGIPDIPAAIAIFLSKVKGRPFVPGKKLLLLDNIFHSVFTYLPLLFFWGEWWAPVATFSVYLHWMIDRESHNKEEYLKTDPSMLWPLPVKLRGFFDYRKHGHGSLFDPWQIGASLLFILIYIGLRVF